MARLLAAFVCLCVWLPVHAEESLALDLDESISRVEVRVRDVFGRTEARPLVLTVFRPRGAGPHPLMVLNHGRAVESKRASQGRFRFEDQARYFVSQGFVVIVPTRVGYGETFGDFDPEYLGCNQNQADHLMRVLRTQVVAALDFARTQPDIDTSRWLAGGVSVGGVTTLTVLQDPPPGLRGGINFSGGFGGDPEKNPGQPCGPHRLLKQLEQPSTAPPQPNLWVYWENDLYWGQEWPKNWFRAWTRGGQPAQLIHLSAISGDGHNGFTRAMDAWIPKVEPFLARLGFELRSRVFQRPEASGFATIEDIDNVPVPQKTRDTLYRRFLEAEPPRAFAVSPSGRAGFARGDWAIGRALGFCQKAKGEICRLYAVDQDVVWPK